MYTLTGNLYINVGGPFSYAFVELLDASRNKISDYQEQDGTLIFTVPNGSYIVRVETELWGPGGYNSQPSEYQVTVCGSSVAGLNFTLGPANYFPQGNPVVIPCSSPSPSPTPTPGPNSATFVSLDTTTEGTWKGLYGSDGYEVVNDTVNYPWDNLATIGSITGHIDRTLILHYGHASAESRSRASPCSRTLLAIRLLDSV